MTKIMTKVLLVVMVLNAVLPNFTFSVFAANQPKSNSKTNFTWNKLATLNEKLEIVERASDSNEVLLIWDIESLGGAQNQNGIYTLTYPIADNKNIEFKIVRKSDKSDIIYKVNGNNDVNDNAKKLLIYKDGTYLQASKQNFPDRDNFKLKETFDGNGKKAKKVSFEIGKNAGATFQYDNNTIKFLWKDSKMYFVTDAVSRGNVYPFKLEYEFNGKKEEESKDIFLGIDTINDFVVKPFANANNQNKEGKDLIYQTQRPITEYPGSSQVGVKITFNMPKEWNPGQPPQQGGKFEFIKPTPDKTNTEVIFNLGHNDPAKKLQIKIQNIYENNNVTINGSPAGDKAEYTYDTGEHNGTLIIKDLDASTIYSDISISAERKNKPFETIPATLPIGTIYTYPSYRVIALGYSEFYLEIEPFKGYDGFYVVYQGDQQTSLSPWSTYQEKNKGKDKILISIPLDATVQQEKFFRVDFSFTPPELETNKLPFTSQTLKYKPFEEDIVLATPKNLEIVRNAVLSNFTFSVFALDKQSKNTSATNFTWNNQATLNEKLETVTRKPDSDEVMLSWDIDQLNGTDKNNGSYTLKYPISKDKVVEFVVTKKANKKAEIEYKVNGKSDVNKNALTLNIYKNDTYIEANKINFPDTDGFKLSSTYEGIDKGAKNVKFEISTGNGAAFQYNGNTIKFIYKEGKIYFVTNGIKKGNIYPFNLSYDNGGVKQEEDKKIFLGVGGVVSKPFANATSDVNNKGEQVIEQGPDKYPGGDIVGVDITFDAPKDWKEVNGNNYKGDFSDVKNNEPVKLVVDLGHIDPNKKLQITIDNIYNGNATIGPNSGNVTTSYSYDKASNKGTITLRNLEASTMYGEVSISSERPGDPFEAIPAFYPVGTVYTYPKYRAIAFGAEEFYLEIEPFKGYDGFYVISQGSLQDSLIKWSTYEEKDKGNNKILIPLPVSAITPQKKYFKVEFNFTPPDLVATLPFTSQILGFIPSEDDIVLSTPKNLQIVNANIIKKDNRDNLKVNYVFYKGIKPDDLEMDSFMGIILEFSEKNGEINIKYEDDKNLNNNNNIEVLIDKCFKSERTEVTDNKTGKILEANVMFKIPVSHKDQAAKILQYPNIYFLAIKGKYEINKKSEETGASLPVTLILSGIQKIEVPVPQNLKILEDTITNEEFSIEYDTLKYESEEDLLYNYNEIMLKTIGRSLEKDSIKYDFYITQNKELFDELVKYSKDTEIPQNIKNKISKYENTGNMTENGIDVDVKSLQGEKGNLLDTLRSKGIVQVSSISQNMDIAKQKIKFKGLDENETYYVVGRTNVTPYKNNKPLGGKIDFSKFTKLVTATTKKDGDSPEENEKVPPAPTKFIAKDITLNSVNLIWDRVKDNK